MGSTQQRDRMMTQFTLVDRQGQEATVEAEAGLTLMEAIRQAGFHQLEAMCGGSCSCATCHVHIEGAGLAPLSEDEDALLDSSDHRQPASRLSCQIVVSVALSGARVVIAPED